MKANQAFKQADEAVSPVIGVILMVAITVVLAAVVFVLVGNLTESGQDAPTVVLRSDPTGAGGVITVQSADTGLTWDEFGFGGTATCDTSGLGNTSLDAGDTITCTVDGTFILSHTATNTVVAEAEV